MYRKYLLVLVFISSLCFSVINAQNINIAFKNVSLSQALTTLNETYQLKFAYDNQLTDSILINKEFNNIELGIVLQKLLEDTELTHKKINDVYILIPLNEIAQEKETKPSEPLKPQKTKCLVQGIVKDEVSGENLPYATITILGTTIGTITNSEGFFSLLTPKCDSLTLNVSYLGYSLCTIRTKASENPVSTVVYMKMQTQFIDAIEVKDKVEIFDNSNVFAPGMIKFNPTKLNNVPSLFELDISAPIQLMPGIDATRETSAGYFIRKSAPDKNLIIYDGFTIYQIDHFFGAFSSFNSKLIKDIQVYKGGYDAKYGGRISGIVDITGKSGNIYRPVVDFGIDMLGIDTKLEVPIIKEELSLIFAARRSYTDYFHTPLYMELFEDTRYDFEDYYRNTPSAFKAGDDEPKYYYYDVGGKLTWKPAENHVFSLSYFESKDDMTFFQTDTFPKINETISRVNRGFGFSWTGTIGPHWQTQFKIGASENTSYFDHSDTTVFTIERRFFTIYDSITKLYLQDNTLNDISLIFDNKIQLNQTNFIETGLNINNFESYYFENSNINNNSKSITDTTRTYNKNSVLISPYIQHVFDNGKINIKAGVRGNYYAVNNKNYPEFRLQAAYRVTSKILFKGALGNYHQFTNKIFFSSKQSFRSSWIVSDDERFPVVSSNFAMIGINANISSSFNIDAEFYKKTVDDLVTSITYRTRVDQQIRQSTHLINFNEEIYGLDVLVKNSFGNYQTWIAYTLSKAISQSDNLNDGNPYPSEQDQKHEFKLFNIYKLKNWNLTLTWIYGSGKPWDEVLLTEDYKLSPDYERNSERLSAYHRMDAGINYQFKYNGAKIKTSLSIYNIYNNINHLDRLTSLSDNPLRDIINGNSPIEYTDVYGLGFMPNVYFNIVF